MMIVYGGEGNWSRRRGPDKNKIDDADECVEIRSGSF